MIAACPRCKTRYRIEREKMRPEGVRLRCARCEALFRVRPPEAAPAAPVAHAPDDLASQAPDPSALANPSAPDPAPEPDDRAPAPSSALPPSPLSADPDASPAAAGMAGAQGRADEAPAMSTAAPGESAPAMSTAAPGESAAATPSAAAEPSAPAGPVVCVAIPDVEIAKVTADGLRARGLRAFVVHDGVEAILEIQRQMPVIVVLAASLPKMFGFQICELVKRNDSLRSIQVVLVGAVHHKDRYRRAPDELYGADAYVEEPDLPEGLYPLIDRLGGAVGASETPALQSPPVPAMPTSPVGPDLPGPERDELSPARETAQSQAQSGPAQAPVEPAAPAASDLASEPQPPISEGPSAPAQAAPAAAGAPQGGPDDDGLAPERQKAERLARIIVSDIVLYNEVRFNEALRVGNVVEALSGELAEGRALFAERVDERVRTERDHLAVELQRVADSRTAR